MLHFTPFMMLMIDKTCLFLVSLTESSGYIIRMFFIKNQLRTNFRWNGVSGTERRTRWSVYTLLQVKISFFTIYALILEISFLSLLPDLKACREPMTQSLQVCLSDQGVEDLERFNAAIDGALDFMCYKGGERIASKYLVDLTTLIMIWKGWIFSTVFMAENGTQCLGSNVDMLTRCMNNTVPDVITAFKEMQNSNASVFDENNCRSVNLLVELNIGIGIWCHCNPICFYFQNRSQIEIVCCRCFEDLFRPDTSQYYWRINGFYV